MGGEGRGGGRGERIGIKVHTGDTRWITQRNDLSALIRAGYYNVKSVARQARRF